VVASPLPSTLLIGSCEAFGGKSAVVLGLLRQLQAARVAVHYGKPLATSVEALPEGAGLMDDDVQFVGSILQLPSSQLLPSQQLLSPAGAQQRLEADLLLDQQAPAALDQVRQQNPTLTMPEFIAEGALDHQASRGLVAEYLTQPRRAILANEELDVHHRSQVFAHVAQRFFQDPHLGPLLVEVDLLQLL